MNRVSYYYKRATVVAENHTMKLAQINKLSASHCYLRNRIKRSNSYKAPKHLIDSVPPHQEMLRPEGSSGFCM